MQTSIQFDPNIVALVSGIGGAVIGASVTVFATFYASWRSERRKRRGIAVALFSEVSHNQFAMHAVGVEDAFTPLSHAASIFDANIDLFSRYTIEHIQRYRNFLDSTTKQMNVVAEILTNDPRGEWHDIHGILQSREKVMKSFSELCDLTLHVLDQEQNFFQTDPRPKNELPALPERFSIQK